MVFHLHLAKLQPMFRVLVFLHIRCRPAPLDNFSHMEAQQWVLDQNPTAGDQLVIVGHSYGGNRAVLFASQLKRLKLTLQISGLATIDPINWNSCNIKNIDLRCLAGRPTPCDQSSDIRAKANPVSSIPLSFTQTQGIDDGAFVSQCLRGYHFKNLPFDRLNYGHTTIDDSGEVFAGVDQKVVGLVGLADTPPLSISQLTVKKLKATSVVITWTTNLRAISFLQYGTTEAYMGTALATENVRLHTLTLSGLAPSTTYHYRVLSVAPGRQVASTLDATFITH
jgi:hypothetical protein